VFEVQRIAGCSRLAPMAIARLVLLAVVLAALAVVLFRLVRAISSQR
jgi:hypothetical protein